MLRSTGSRCAGSVAVAHRPSCSAACGILPDQGSNLCPLHWQADAQPLRHQGSPCFPLLIRMRLFSIFLMLAYIPSHSHMEAWFRVMVKPQALEPDHEGANPSSATYQLFDLRWMTYPTVPQLPHLWTSTNYGIFLRGFLWGLNGCKAQRTMPGTYYLLPSIWLHLINNFKDLSTLFNNPLLMDI